MALNDNLAMAKNCIKKQVDQHCSERSFEFGDQVFLHLQPYKKISLKPQDHQKLALKFYGPNEVIKYIGLMSYKLALPDSSKIHPIFHVFCLKKVVGLKCTIQTKLP